MATTTTTTTTTTMTTNPFRAPAVNASAAGPGNLDNGLDEELPPAYTPAPDVQHGESTVQYGPQRAFQTAPPAQNTPHTRPTSPPAQSRPTPPVRRLTQTQSLFRQIRDSINSAIDDASTSRPRPSSNWSSYPGTRTSVSAHTEHPGPPSPSAPPLPPRPATATDSRPPPMSDFAREFYAAGPGNPQHQRRPSASFDSGSASHAPTSTPTPGRPLLRDGKLLVYPKAFVCSKCTSSVTFVSTLYCSPLTRTGNNVGYKHSDPANPCKKCWNKYAKPFSGPLAYSFSAPSDSSAAFQRPLPNFRSPRSPPHPPQGIQFGHGYASDYGYHLQPRPPPQPRTISLNPYAAPPPGVPVYSAGDPRLGGHVCWNCAGKGKVCFFFLDSTTCDVCAGIGRVYV